MSSSSLFLVILFVIISGVDGDPCGLPPNITIEHCSSTGYLYTPNIGSGSYAANLSCTWTLTVPAACPYGIVAHFDWLSTDCSDTVNIDRGPHRLATWAGVPRSNAAFANSPCQERAPLGAIYLSNKYPTGNASQLTIQLQSSSAESKLRQGFSVSFTALSLTHQSFGSNVDDAFILTKSSALISASDQLNSSSAADSERMEAFILPPADQAFDISVIGNGQLNDTISIMCISPIDDDNGNFAAYPVKEFHGVDNISMTLCVRPAIVVRNGVQSVDAQSGGIVANYFSAAGGERCSVSTPSACGIPPTSLPSKSSLNVHCFSCLFIFVSAAVTINNLTRR